MSSNKKLTIGIFNDSFYPQTDGVISVVDNYARELSKYANVIVFGPKVPNKNYDDSKFPYKVVRCKSINMHIIDYACPTPIFDKEFRKELKNSNLDIVHIHSPFFISNAGIKYAKKHNIPVIGTMHSQFEQDLVRAIKIKWLSKLLNRLIIIRKFNKCDECFAVNKEVARIFYEDYHYKTLPKVLNNATEMKPIKNKEKAKQKINKLHNLKKSDNIFLFVGRINKLKNIFFIADSLKLLKDQHKDFSFKMLFVGNGQDYKEFKSYIKKLKMNDNIIMCGKVTDRELLASYFLRADLFLFPSMYDASSIVQIEAASQHTPSLFLEDSATSATVTNNVNGIICKNDINDFANKIYEIMNDKKKLKELSNNAYNDLYVSWKDKVKEAYNIYLKHINNKKNL